MTQYMKAPFEPIEVSDLESAFPANVEHLMPALTDIPEEFRERSSNWLQLVNRWFEIGLPATVQFAPNEPFSAEKAYRHLDCILRSFQPKHEHKMAAMAYLSSLWFHGVRVGPGGELLAGEDWTP